MKQEENDGRIENVREPGNRNEIEVMKLDGESNGEEDGATREAQPKKYENPTSNIDTTNDNTCNSCTSASRDIDNGKVTNMETKSVTNDEGNKGEGSETEAEAEAETEADTNSEDSKNNGNTGIGSNSKCNSVYTKILKPPDKNKNKKIGNNVGLNEDNSSEMQELQQQKCENAMAGRNNDYDENSGGTKTVTNTETNLVTTNIEGNNGEEVEEEAEAETEVATNKSNNSNTALITVQLLEEQVRKMKILETRIREAGNDGLEKNRREQQQQRQQQR